MREPYFRTYGPRVVAIKLAVPSHANVHVPGTRCRRMLCYYCENQARATCRFCGAGVCKSHVAAARFASGGATPDPMSGLQRSEYVLVNNAIWCGRCQAQWFVAPPA